MLAVGERAFEAETFGQSYQHWEVVLCISRARRAKLLQNAQSAKCNLINLLPNLWACLVLFSFLLPPLWCRFCC